MSKCKALSLPVLGCMFFFIAFEAEAQWSSLKTSLQSDVQIVAETKTRLVLYHRASGDSLVLATVPQKDADIYGAFEVRRGGNPYRVWVVTEKFSSAPHLSAAAGEKFFRTSFLKTLREDAPLVESPQNQVAPAREGLEVTSTPDFEKVATAQAEGKINSAEAISQFAAIDSLTVDEQKEPAVVLSQRVEQPAAVFEAKPSSRIVRRKLPSGTRHPKIVRPPAPPEPRAEVTASAAPLDSLYQLALAAMQQADWRSAVFNLEKIQLIQPNYRDVVDLLARARANLTASEPSVTAVPDSGSSVFVGGAIAAIGAFVALILLPFIGVILVSSTARVRYHMFRGHYAEAAQIYEKQLARRPGRKKLYLALANLYLRLGRRDEAALRVYEMALQLDLAERHREEINSIVSNNYLTKGRTDARAIEVLEDALKAERLKQKKRKS